MSFLPVLAGVVGVPVLLVAGGAAVGLFLPKGHIAARSVSYAASPDAVWALVADWEARSSWRAGIRSVERLPDRNGHQVWRERSRRGAVASEVIAFEPARRRMVTRIVDESAFGGTWTWQVEAEGAGSRLSITEDGAIYNPVFRTVARLFLDMRSTMDGLHRDLRARLGEPPPDYKG